MKGKHIIKRFFSTKHLAYSAGAKDLFKVVDTAAKPQIPRINQIKSYAKWLKNNVVDNKLTIKCGLILRQLAANNYSTAKEFEEKFKGRGNIAALSSPFFILQNKEVLQTLNVFDISKEDVRDLSVNKLAEKLASLPQDIDKIMDTINNRIRAEHKLEEAVREELRQAMKILDLETQELAAKNMLITEILRIVEYISKHGVDHNVMTMIKKLPLKAQRIVNIAIQLFQANLSLDTVKSELLAARVQVANLSLVA